MNENDKKFITNTFEDVLDKKFDTLQKAIIDQQKTYQQYVEERTEEDKESLLKELQDQTNKGNSTLAKQIEQLKLEREDKTKQALKSVRDGGKSILHGSDQILTQIASIHPMLSILYGGTKTIGKGTWNIGKGLFGVGKGLFGLGKTAVGGVNALVQNFSKMFNKKQTSEEQTEDVKETKTSMGGIQPQEEPTAMKIIEQKTSMPKAMAGLQDVLLNQQKDNKKTSNMLSTGLAGLGKTMNIIGTTLSLVADKGKLIATLVGTAVLALLAIRGWVVNGGFDKFMDKAVLKIKDGFGSGMAPKAREAADNYIKKELENIDQSVNVVNTLNNNANFDTYKIEDVTKFKDNNERNIAQQDIYKKAGLTGNYQGVVNTMNLVQSKLDYGTNGFVDASKSKIKGTISLKFPFVVTISEIQPIPDTDPQEFQFLVMRKTPAGKMAALTYVGALKVNYKNGQKAERNTEIAVLKEGFILLGNRANFFNLKDNEQLDEAAINKMKQDEASSIFAGAEKEARKQFEGTNPGTYAMERDMLHTVPDYQKEDINKYINGDNKKVTQTPVPKSDVNDKNQSSSKVDEQDKREQDLAKQPKQKPQQVAGAPQPGESKNNKIAFTGSGAQGTTQFGDQMNLHQFDAAAPNRQAITAV